MKDRTFFYLRKETFLLFISCYLDLISKAMFSQDRYNCVSPKSGHIYQGGKLLQRCCSFWYSRLLLLRTHSCTMVATNIKVEGKENRNCGRSTFSLICFVWFVIWGKTTGRRGSNPLTFNYLLQWEAFKAVVGKHVEESRKHHVYMPPESDSTASWPQATQKSWVCAIPEHGTSRGVIQVFWGTMRLL